MAAAEPPHLAADLKALRGLLGSNDPGGRRAAPSVRLGAFSRGRSRGAGRRQGRRGRGRTPRRGVRRSGSRPRPRGAGRASPGTRPAGRARAPEKPRRPRRRREQHPGMPELQRLEGQPGHDRVVHTAVRPTAAAHRDPSSTSGWPPPGARRKARWTPRPRSGRLGMALRQGLATNSVAGNPGRVHSVADGCRTDTNRMSAGFDAASRTARGCGGRCRRPAPADGRPRQVGRVHRDQPYTAAGLRHRGRGPADARDPTNHGAARTHGRYARTGSRMPRSAGGSLGSCTTPRPPVRSKMFRKKYAEADAGASATRGASAGRRATQAQELSTDPTGARPDDGQNPNG